MKNFVKENRRRLTLFLVFAFCFLFLYLFWELPLPTQLTSEVHNPVSTQLFDRNGNLIYEIFEEKRRTPIALSDLPPYVAEATISIEDKDFYKHYGFSVRGIARAIFAIVAKKDLQGGSTITQQLVKTTLLTPERTVKRKIREFALSLIIETLYSKDKILEMYLNNVPYGGTAWGIEAASHAYFDKSAKDLTLPEASLLAGLPAAPTRFSPFGVNPDLAKERQKTVLRRMTEDGYITQEEADQALATPLVYVKQRGLHAPHFALLVKEQLVEKYGEHIVERGGLRVTTTLDLPLQEFAQDTVATEVARLKKANAGNGAALVTNPQTGEVYALVGSKDYFAEDEDGKVNVTIRPRQPGSAIKPLNYALALETGKLTPATPLADVPTCFSVLGQPLWCPVNYDETFHGLVQARFALANSYNIPAVRVLALNSLPEFVDFAKRMGISTLREPSDYGLSLTLGGGEVRMVDMAQAFGVFATGGIKQPLVTILEVKDWRGNVLEKTETREGDRIIPQEVAYLISHILLDNGARTAAFGPSSFLVVSGHPEVSVKTGTTNDKRDNWTIGFSPEVVTAVWVGNNDNTPMSAVASGVTGASPIWNKIIREALDRIEAGVLSGSSEPLEKHQHVWPLKPDGVVGTNVCATTGALPVGPEADPGCPIRFEFFLQDYPPKPSEPLNQAVWVYKDTGMLAAPDALPEQIEIKDKTIVVDPLGTIVCLECPIQEWSVTINPGRLVQPNLAPPGEDDED
ncbi:MAG: transglycosylase domain-containing protein [Candidatus Blackburnbacteria bacterium]|nr:transglycosylase domain-containing protein [Candidatus Blackburnbacteria bacterium]